MNGGGIPWPKAWTKRRRAIGKLTYSLRDCAIFLLLLLLSSGIRFLRPHEPSKNLKTFAMKEEVV